MMIHHLQYPFKSKEYPPCSLAIGYFDGVHLGHQRVIQRAVDKAKEKGLASAVMTFHPHPREVLGQSGYSHYLTPLEDKLELLERMGLDMAYVVHFDIPFSSVYPEDFIDEILVPLHAEHVVVGFDYTFGYQGRGTAFTLQQHSEGRYGLDVVPPVNRFGEKVSSTVVREYLYGGKIEEAATFLGRPYALKGTVIHGQKRGRTIGFPTANLGLDQPYLIPRTGVYGVRVHCLGQTHYGVMNIGIKPTFEQEKKEKSLEVYIFDLEENLYDKEMKVEFLFFIREEQKFAGVDQLVQQIREDVRLVKERLGSIIY